MVLKRTPSLVIELLFIFRRLVVWDCLEEVMSSPDKFYRLTLACFYLTYCNALVEGLESISYRFYGSGNSNEIIQVPSHISPHKEGEIEEWNIKRVKLPSPEVGLVR
jgi:hypothetical protein